MTKSDVEKKLAKGGRFVITTKPLDATLWNGHGFRRPFSVYDTQVYPKDIASIKPVKKARG